MIDSHCHIAGDEFGSDLEAVVTRARAAGLERALVILAADDEAEAAQANRVERLWPECRVAIGVHPHAANDFAGNAERAADVVRAQIGRTPSARAVGEIGIDYHYDYAPRAVQHAVFRAQLQVARELRLPVVIHTREADADTLTILREEGRGDLQGVLHCFTGSADLARASLDLGFYLSLAGIVTFNSAATLRETARLVPLDRLLAETDSPFLAPMPHRGKRNEPAFVTYVVEALSRIHQVPVEEIAARSTANFHRLFRP